MDKSQISDAGQIRDRQYANSDRLAARARLHRNYTVAEEGWFEWLVRRL